MSRTILLQGHRGARGLKPENTLPGFEFVLDLGVQSIETDIHLSKDDVPVLLHEHILTPQYFSPGPGGVVADLETHPMVRSLTLPQLRRYRADRNPDPRLYPDQDNSVTPVARMFAEQHGFDPYAPPSLADLFAFVAAYAGDMGLAAGKTDVQRAGAAVVEFDLDIKRVPFRPEYIGDGFTGLTAGPMEKQLLAVIRDAGVVARTTVRSFNHHCTRLLREMEPGLTGSILVVGTCPITPVALATLANAQIYSPEYEYLDEVQVRQCHEAGMRVIPWTVNDPDDARILLEWGVDGITTDFPDRFLSLVGPAAP